MTWAPCARPSEAMTPESDFARVRILDTDSALQRLLEEWLAEEGCRIVEDAPDLVIVDLPHPRRGASEVVRPLALRYPGAAVVALSSNFFPSVQASGALARELGVAAVLPKPLTREALVGTLRRLLPRFA